MIYWVVTGRSIENFAPAIFKLQSASMYSSVKCFQIIIFMYNGHPGIK